jgi:hypothetical protein
MDGPPHACLAAILRFAPTAYKKACMDGLILGFMLD